jgi:hypothetical protein
MSCRLHPARYDCATPPKLTVLSRAIALMLCVGCIANVEAAGKPDSATDEKIARMQAQIDALQKELQSLKSTQDRQVEQTAQVQQIAQAVQEQATKANEKTAAANKKPVLWDGPVSLTLGGFVDLTEMYRSRNMVADIATTYNAIPYAISPNHDISEFRASARQSRLSLLAQGPSDGNQHVEAYFEGDFFGAAPTSNSGESNSYTPRLRQAYATYSNDATGLYLLAGQAWSLATLDKTASMRARNEVIPNVLDAQYVVGFDWTRAAQVRLVDQFSNTLSAGISLEGPQTSFFTGPNAPLIPTVTTNPGGALFAPTVNYSLDVAPDVIGKVSFDPAFGHLEAYGVGRWFRSRIGSNNNTQFGGGVGAGAFVPIGKAVDLEATVLSGNGIGRYGSGQLPDVTIKPNAELEPIKETTAMIGLVGHVTPTVDLFGYLGTERDNKKAFTVESGDKLLAYGYGNPLYSNAGCLNEGASAATCVANTKQLAEIAIGGYWKFYKGDVGTMQAGLQMEHIKREIFDGIGGSPSADLNVLFFSLRYFPFQ